MEHFFRDTNESVAADWSNAVERVRLGDVSLDALGRVSADTPVMVTVERIEHQTASDNRVDDQTAIAA